MKVIIAGSRDINEYDELLLAVKYADFKVTEVVSGTANGVDKMGERWAKEQGIPITRFPANWKEQGFSAGYFRNVRMGEYADALIAVWDGESKGTASMIRIMRMRMKPVYVHKVVADWF